MRLTKPRTVVRDVQATRAWIFGVGIQRERSCIVGTDSNVTDKPVMESKWVIGGFSIIEVATHQDAFAWAAGRAVTAIDSLQSGDTNRSTSGNGARLSRRYSTATILYRAE